MIVVSDAIQVWFRRDRNPIVGLPKAYEVQDASKSSRAIPHSVRQQLPEREAYITIDALKNFMTTIVDILLQQVAEQLKKTMEAASSMRLLPVFDYEPKRGWEPSSWRDHSRSQCEGQGLRSVTWPPVVNNCMLSTETVQREGTDHPGITSPPQDSS